MVRHKIVADIVAAYDRGGAGPTLHTAHHGAANGSAPMSLDIYAADEQADHPVAVERWAALARSVLEAEGITTTPRCRCSSSTSRPSPH